MSDHAQNLRQAADEIRREGHVGWGNACEWAADEIERLTAALRAQPGPVSIDDMEWAGKVHLAEAIRERDELRRQLAEAELDAQRYRWLRNEANTARKCDPMVCIYPLDEQDLIDGDRLDIAIDAVMGGGDA